MLRYPAEMQDIHIIGGGLAGCEAAWQVARRGLDCVLHEMRPVRPTPAHQTDRLAELVCSNSLKSESESTAPWLLKEELRRLDSMLLAAAKRAVKQSMPPTCSTGRAASRRCRPECRQASGTESPPYRGLRALPSHGRGPIAAALRLAAGRRC